jgi:hypothetical protein
MEMSANDPKRTSAQHNMEDLFARREWPLSRRTSLLMQLGAYHQTPGDVSRL